MEKNVINTDLSGKTAVVTGAGGVLCSYFAKVLARAGAKVALLDLNEEAKNPQFLRLLNSGVDVGTAFTVIHKDEIIPAAMQYTAKTVEQKMTNKIIAGGSRPTENGNSAQGAINSKSDVSLLTKADRDEIARRVARGEKITFG
jgi:NAD(P)-dependent dehydrogenase (short-subunit alcohol dehydrogenase family)